MVKAGDRVLIHSNLTGAEYPATIIKVDGNQIICTWGFYDTERKAAMHSCNIDQIIHVIRARY